MMRTISLTELHDNLDALLAAARAGDAVIVEKDGAPDVVVISAARYAALERLREQQRAAAQQRFETLERYLNEHPDHILTDEEIELIAIHVGREINAAVTRKWRESMASRRSQ